MTHFIQYCQCGNVLAQCRCPDPNKEVLIREVCTCSKPGHGLPEKVAGGQAMQVDHEEAMRLADEILAKERASKDRDGDFDVTPYFYEQLLPLALAYIDIQEKAATYFKADMAWGCLAPESLEYVASTRAALKACLQSPPVPPRPAHDRYERALTETRQRCHGNWLRPMMDETAFGEAVCDAEARGYEWGLAARPAPKTTGAATS